MLLPTKKNEATISYRRLIGNISWFIKEHRLQTGWVIVLLILAGLAKGFGVPSQAR